MSTTPPPSVRTALLAQCRSELGEVEPKQGIFDAFVKGPLSPQMQAAPPHIRDLLVAPPWIDEPPVTLPAASLAALTEIQKYHKTLADKGFGKQGLDEHHTRVAVDIHQQLTKTTAETIIARALKHYGTLTSLATMWPALHVGDEPPTGDDDTGDRIHKTPAEMDALLVSLMLHKKPGCTMVSALLANVVLLDMSFQLPAYRSSIPKGCPGQAVAIFLNTTYTWEGGEPIGPIHGGVSRAGGHRALCRRILTANGRLTWPVATGQIDVRCALQPAQPGGATVCTYGLMSALVHAGTHTVAAVPFDDIMMLVDNTFIVGKGGEVPKISMPMKTFNSIQIFYLLFTSGVLRGPTGAAGEAWDAVMAEIKIAATPRQKIHSHVFARDYTKLLRMVGTLVAYDIPALAAMAAPFVPEITKLLTDPMQRLPISSFVAAGRPWQDTVQAYLAPGPHWPYGVPNAAAVALMEYLEPGAVGKAVWAVVIQRYTDTVISESMVGGARSIWETLTATLASTGLTLQSSLWAAAHDDGDVRQPVLSIANVTCRLGLRSNNAQVLSIIVQVYDTSGCLYRLFVAPRSRCGVLATCTTVAGMVPTSVCIALAHVGASNASMLALSTTGALWPDDIATVTLAGFFSAVAIEVRNASQCIRTLDVSAAYVSKAESAANRRQLKDVVADIPLGPQRAAFDKNRPDQTTTPTRTGMALARRSCQRHFLTSASVSFIVASRDSTAITRFMVVLIPMVRAGRAVILPVWLAFAKASWEYYNRFTHAPLDVAELAAEMGGLSGAAGKRWLTQKLRDMFLETTVHIPGMADTGGDVVLDDTAFSCQLPHCPYATKVASARSKDDKRSIISNLRANTTLPTILYHFAVDMGTPGDLGQEIDRGLALMPGIMHLLFGLTAYEKSDEVCGHSDTTEQCRFGWINAICIATHTQEMLEKENTALTQSLIELVQTQSKQIEGLLGPDEFMPGDALLDGEEPPAAAAEPLAVLGPPNVAALNRLAGVLRSSPAPLVAPPPPPVPTPAPQQPAARRPLVVTWRRCGTAAKRRKSTPDTF